MNAAKATVVILSTVMFVTCGRTVRVEQFCNVMGIINTRLIQYTVEPLFNKHFGTTNFTVTMHESCLYSKELYRGLRNWLQYTD